MRVRVCVRERESAHSRAQTKSGGERERAHGREGEGGGGVNDGSKHTQKKTR